MSNSSLSFQDYLKKTSFINNKFIDDFLSLCNKNTNETEFVIDSDVISKWLSISKGSIKKTLIKNYRLKIDYIIKNEKSDNGRMNEKVLLTCDCFKQLCMLSRTNKAEEVRSYFLDLEKHLDKYKNYIMEGLNHKIKIYEKQQHLQSKSPEKGLIYIVKINKSSEKQTKNKKKTINSKDIANTKKISKSL